MPFEGTRAQHSQTMMLGECVNSLFILPKNLLLFKEPFGKTGKH